MRTSLVEPAAAHAARLTAKGRDSYGLPMHGSS